MDSSFHSAMHTVHAQIKAPDLHHVDPGEGCCSSQSTCQILAWSLACACSDSSFGSAFLMVLGYLYLELPLTLRGYALNRLLLYIFVSTSSPTPFSLTFSVSKASYWWGEGSSRLPVTHPKSVTKCGVSNSCLMKFLFCFFVFQFMPD